MKSELQVQLETALLGKLKTLCRQLKGLKVELGSVQMKNSLIIAKYFWVDGSKYVMDTLAAQAQNNED